MDEAVVRALAKWPNVPACHGWLSLDARGRWRIGAERELIRHAGLIDFIARNYLAGADGAWYFQNGPQRVYVSLETAPLILRHQPGGQWTTHVGQPVQRVDAALMDEAGGAWLVTEHGPASVDDRDLATVAELIEGLESLDPERWIRPAATPPLILNWGRQRIAVKPLQRAAAGTTLGFQADPSAGG